MRYLLLTYLLALAACNGRPVVADESKDDPPPAKKDGKDDRKDGKDKEPKKEKKEFAPIEDIHHEVAVLQTLYSLGATAEQREALARLAGKSMQEAPPLKETKVTERYRKALTGLRAALAKRDADAIDAHYKALDDAREKEEEPAFEPIQVTAEARKQAPALLKQFSARQVASHLLGVESFPDPYEILEDTLEQSRTLKGDEWKNAREDAAFEAGWLIAGLDEKAAEAIQAKAGTLLDKARKLDEADFKKQRPALLKEARALLGGLGPTDIIRHYMERVLAETLSNHRLSAALKRAE